MRFHFFESYKDESMNLRQYSEENDTEYDGISTVTNGKNEKRKHLYNIIYTYE